MSKPLMPKGVEHSAFYEIDSELQLRVSKPLMPKGVEHVDQQAEAQTKAYVSNPLMSKGVEHKCVV